MTPIVFERFRDFAASYDAFLCDLWGVLHDGARLFPGALGCLQELKAAGKPVVLLTNSPRRRKTLEPRLADLGLTQDLYYDLVSSGEVVWEHLSQKPDRWHQALGAKGYLIGAPGDEHLLAGLPQEFVGRPEDADFLLAAGLNGGAELPLEFRELLQAAAKRGLPFLCANPDRAVIHGGERLLCAGALAELYEELGGSVRYYGKPDPAIYTKAFQSLKSFAKGRIAAIGDSLITDLAGATAAGIDALFITQGLHAEEFVGASATPDELEALFAKEGLRARAVMQYLAW